MMPMLAKDAYLEGVENGLIQAINALCTKCAKGQPVRYDASVKHYCHDITRHTSTGCPASAAHALKSKS